MMHRSDAQVNPALLVNADTGDTTMFGLSHIIRHARRWQANHRRAAMERVMFDLPLELRKDIGWPVPQDSATESDSDGGSRSRWMH
tara:strand:+ start:2799 stop:3056 length:258 start_codon:yes stop_codon:yes gene_type:complete